MADLRAPRGTSGWLVVVFNELGPILGGAVGSDLDGALLSLGAARWACARLAGGLEDVVAQKWNQREGKRVAGVERTLVIVKPDGVQRGLVGEIVGRLERRGLKIVAMRMTVIQRALAEQHYAEHAGKAFYESLVSYIGSGPSLTMVLEGPSAIAATRSTVGKTNPAEAAPGTIRGDLGLMVGRNLIHASDSVDSSAREVDLFFGTDALVEYERDIDRWVLER